VLQIFNQYKDRGNESAKYFHCLNALDSGALLAMTRLPDKLYRVFFRIAYILMRVFWFVFRPQTRGVVIAIRHKDTVLIIKNSYYHQFALPGGYVKRHETPRTAAVRELQEEVGLKIAPKRLRLIHQGKAQVQHKREILAFFEANFSSRPLIRIDNREVVWAAFIPLANALSMNLSPAVRGCLNKLGDVVD
jgi:ADP-ribose pyrophosphatase YjhB (NUDIX family)